MKSLNGSESQEHASIAECVGFHIAQIEELGDAGVVGPTHFRIDLGGDGGAVDLRESVTVEELGLERQNEQPFQLQFLGDLDEFVDDVETCALDRKSVV